MYDSKKWYQSLTIWFNLLYLIIALAGSVGWDTYQANPEWATAVASIVALVNIVIRWVKTRQPIG